MFTVARRERHKLALYLRLKNSKGTSKFLVFFFTVPEKPKSWSELARRRPGALKGGTFWDFKNLFCFLYNNNLKAKHKLFLEKGSQCRKNWQGNPLVILFSTKVSQCRNKSERAKGPFSLAGFCMLRWKKERLLYFSSLCQMILKVSYNCRLPVDSSELFCPVRVDWKKKSH